MMLFEYDQRKSDKNLSKHGIDFEDAKELWDDSKLLEIPAKNIDEPRFLIIAKLREKHWSAIITYRKNIIRIISVRRARKEEVNLYEG